MEAPPINGNHVIEESEVDKPTEVEMETLAMEEQPTKEISIETNGPTNEIPIESNGISEDPKVWQYWLSSFQEREKKYILKGNYFICVKYTLLFYYIET